MWRMPRRTKSLLSPIGVLALTLSSLACTGVMDNKQDGMGPVGSSGSTGTGGSGSTPIDSKVATTQPVDPGVVGVHRLNTSEYNSTVQDVLGTKLAPADGGWRGGELGGFDNMASVLGVDATQFRRYFDAAELLLKDVFADPTMRGKIVICATTDDACVKSILTTTGTRIFRRPLTADELTTYAKVYAVAKAQGDDHNASVKLMVQSLLSSAEFLYRIEFDANPASTDKHPLTAYELATRLSYFLWSSAPDDQLLAAAANNTLTKDDVLAGAVDYMLKDVKSNRLVLNFAGQWLGARRVVPHPTAPEVYPNWNPTLADAAAQEMYLYFNEFLRSSRPWTEFMTADINYVNADLAKAYGMMPPAGSGMVRVENVADGRRGFAGLMGFLAMSSPDRRSSPTSRGKWLLMNLMCTVPPDPPPDIPKLEAKGDTTSGNVRDVLEAHRANPACAACHSLFDPFGLSLEQYDGVGKFRTTYSGGSTINPATELTPSAIAAVGYPPADYPNGLKFAGIETKDGVIGVADAVTKNPKFATCISQKMLTYSLGRLLTDTDTPYLDVVNKAWLADPTKATVSNLVQGLVSTETFRFRRGEGT